MVDVVVVFIDYMNKRLMILARQVGSDSISGIFLMYISSLFREGVPNN